MLKGICDLNNCDTKEKQFNREIILTFFGKSLRNKNLKKVNVACLPGPKILEVINIYDKLGILRKNIYCFTNNQDEYEYFKSINNINALLIDILNEESFFNILKYLRSKNQTVKLANRWARIYNPFFDIIYFDLYSNFNFAKIALLTTFMRIFLKDGGIGGITLYGAREKDAILKDYIINMSKLGLTKDFSRNQVLFNMLYLGFSNNERKNGFYPTDILKTKYIANGTPMFTVLCKFRSLNHINKFRRKSILENAYMNLTEKLTLNITKDKESNIEKEQVNPKIKINEKLFSTRQKIKNLNKQLSDIKEKQKVAKRQYGKLVKNDIVYLLKNDIPDSEILDTYMISKQQLAAYKAHITMGTY